MSDEQGQEEYAAKLRVAAELLETEARKAGGDAAPSPLENKLVGIAKKLTAGDLSIDELKRLQVETDVLETVLTAATNYHHHDTNEHHDHETYVLDARIFSEIDPLKRG